MNTQQQPPQHASNSPTEPSHSDSYNGIADLVNAQVGQALAEKLEEEHLFQAYLKILQEITIELTQIDDLDEFYRQVVIFGRDRLGFDRIAMFLFEVENWTAIGTFGTDIHGQLTDERHHRFKLVPDGAMERAYQRTERFCFDEDVPLYGNMETIGVNGWNAASVLWDGLRGLGWLVVDNAINHKPASKALFDTLGLYSLTVGSLLARKRSQTALRQSEADYRLLAENITDVIMRIAPTGIVTYISPSCRTVFGYPPEVLIGYSCFDLVHPEDRDLLQLILATALQQPLPDLRASYRFLHQDGRYIWLEITARIVRVGGTGEIQEFIASARDITERKRAEDALRLTLEREKELGQLKSRFAMMASHEFRTPLANILSAAEMLTAYRQRMNDAQVDEKLTRIGAQVVHLNDIIDDVLQVSRTKSEQVEFVEVEFDLDTFCHEAIEVFQNREDVSYRIHYTCETAPLMVRADRRLMRRIIDNLVSNAIKFSLSTQPIQVRLEVNQGFAVLTVQDEGIGIPASDLKRIFDAFHRAANVEMIAGTGLGLAITKEAVDAHRGTITVASEVGVGTTFTVRIPHGFIGT